MSDTPTEAEKLDHADKYEIDWEPAPRTVEEDGDADD